MIIISIMMENIAITPESALIPPVVTPLCHGQCKHITDLFIT